MGDHFSDRFARSSEILKAKYVYLHVSFPGLALHYHPGITIVAEI